MTLNNLLITNAPINVMPHYPPPGHGWGHSGVLILPKINFPTPRASCCVKSLSPLFWSGGDFGPGEILISAHSDILVQVLMADNYSSMFCKLHSDPTHSSPTATCWNIKWTKMKHSKLTVYWMRRCFTWSKTAILMRRLTIGRG